MNKLKAICELKSKLNELELAKLNAERARLGLPPKRPWYEDLYVNCLSWARDFCLEAFCPCFLASYRKKSKYWKQQLVYQKNPLRRSCLKGTYENQVFGNIFGFCAGIALTVLMYFVLVFISGYDGKLSMSIAICVGSVISLGLAFSAHVRCLVFLIIPQIFSKQGRYYVMFYTMIIILQGPAENATKNLEIISETMTCLQGTIYKETLEGLNSMESPLGRILYPIYRLLEHLKNIVKHIRSAFKAVKAVFKGILSTLKSIGKFLKNVVFTCDREMKKPFLKCMKKVRVAIKDCRRKGFGNICDISHVASGFCHVARVGEIFCKMLKTVKSFFRKNIGDKLSGAVNAVKKEFRVGVSFNRHFNNTFVAEKSFQQIWHQIKMDIEQRAHWIYKLASILQYLSIFGIGYLIIKALVYRKLYLTKENWDNHYITSEFREIDERREEMEIETLLPLHSNESVRYIRSSSVQLTARERRRLIEGLLTVLGAMTQGLYYMGLDWGTFYSIKMFRNKAAINMDDFVDDDVIAQVSGKGIMSTIFRSILEAFDPIKDELKRIDLDKCLPIPSPPDSGTYQRIFLLWAISVLLAFLSAYVLRTKHSIMAHFYPERERERAVWLYNAILRQRGGIGRWIRRNLRRRKILGSWEQETMGGGEDLTFFQRLEGRFSWLSHLRTLTGNQRKNCVVCAKSGKKDDNDSFTECPNGDCQGIYCTQCFSQVGSECILCMSPIEFGDESDFSEEVDSSADERKINNVNENATGTIENEVFLRFRTLEPIRTSTSSSSAIYSSRQTSGHEVGFHGGSLSESTGQWNENRRPRRRGSSVSSISSSSSSSSITSSTSTLSISDDAQEPLCSRRAMERGRNRVLNRVQKSKRIIRMSDDLDGSFEARNIGGKRRKLCVRGLSFEQQQEEKRMKRRRRWGNFENDELSVEKGEVEEVTGDVDRRIPDVITSVSKVGKGAAKAKNSDMESFDYQFEEKGYDSSSGGEASNQSRNCANFFRHRRVPIVLATVSDLDDSDQSDSLSEVYSN